MNDDLFLPPLEIEQIANALNHLAAVCDGAHEEDGVGFNKFDTDFGKNMAAKGTDLTDGQAQAACMVLQRYRKQLEKAGYEIPTESTLQTALKEAPPRTANLVTTRNQRVFVYFTKTPQLETRQRMKAIQGWHWEKELPAKPWSFPGEQVFQVTTMFAGTHTIDDDVALLEGETVIKQRDNPVYEEITITAGDNQRLLINFPYGMKPPQDDIDKVKKITGRKWEKNLPGSPWSVPVMQYAALLDAFPTALCTDDVRELLDKVGVLKAMARAETSNYRIDGLNTDYGTPRPYQWAAMEFIEKSDGRCIVADDQGLGKCLENLGFVQNHPTKRPVLIICPASAKSVWYREINNWLTTGDTPELLATRKPYDTTGTILIINYEILSYWADHLRFKVKPQVVIIDEAHYAKNPNSQRTKAIFKIVHGKERKKKTDRWSYTSEPVPHVLPTTGTPIENKPMEIWTPLHLVAPDVWGSQFQFGRDFGLRRQGHFGWEDVKNPNTAPLFEAIKPYVLRRTKDQVLTELPPKMYIPLPLEITTKHKREYMQEMERVAREIKALEARGIPQNAQHLTLIGQLKQITARGKIDTLIPWVQDTIAQEKLILMCHHTEIIDRFMTEFGDQAVEISGRVPVGAKRDEAEYQFMNNPKVRLCVANMKAGGVALTLTAASKLLFVEFPWNPKDIEQASDRVHRFGQDQQVMIYFACAADTIDEMIVQVLIHKNKNIDEIMDGQSKDQLNVITEVVTRFKEHARQLGLEI